MVGEQVSGRSKSNENPDSCTVLTRAEEMSRLGLGITYGVTNYKIIEIEIWKTKKDNLTYWS